jgi:predicted metal-dependent hydrolase
MQDDALMPVLGGKNKTISYELRRSPKAKRLRIRVRPGQVEVVAPVKVRDWVIKAFVRENRSWIEEKKAELAEKIRQSPLPQPIPLVTGAKIPLRGSHTGLTVRDRCSDRTVQVSYESDLLVTLPAKLAATEKDAAVKAALKDWFLEQLHSDVEEISDHFTRCLRVKPQKIRFRRQKTRWGSCSAKGNINLNWHLIFVPRPMLEYVVVHELCHLRHLNHSREFWALVASQIPDYKARSKWLREYRPNFPSEFWD